MMDIVSLDMTVTSSGESSNTEQCEKWCADLLNLPFGNVSGASELKDKTNEVALDVDLGNTISNLKKVEAVVLEENQGRIINLQAPPGNGKSTLPQSLREAFSRGMPPKITLGRIR